MNKQQDWKKRKLHRKVTKNKHLEKIIETLLLNAYSIEQPGVLSGKAGISMTLFELSRRLNDERLENHAFDLLQEFLAHDAKENDFISGRAGLAYSVHYLIDNKFIDADYFELYGEQHDAVIKTVKALKYDALKSFDYIYYLFFIHSLRQYIDRKDYAKCTDVLVSLIIKALNKWEDAIDIKTGGLFHFYATVLLSIKHLQNEVFVKKIHRIQRKLEQLDYVCQYPLFPVQMYFAGLKEYNTLVRSCMDNIVIQAVDFKQKTDLIVNLYRLYHADSSLDYRAEAENMMSTLIDEEEQSFENKLCNIIVEGNVFGFGTGCGLCRLILLDIFKDKILQGENVELLTL
jgi:hypothetical protein